MDPIRAMNCFLTLTFFIILSLTLVQPPSYLIAAETVHIIVHNAFIDGRQMLVQCFSNKPFTPLEILVDGIVVQAASASWILTQFSAETVHTCTVRWPYKYVNLEFKFKAFKGSWGVGYFPIRDSETGDLAYGWMFNETGFFIFDYPRKRYKAVLRKKKLMSKAWFYQPVDIHVTNRFTDGRSAVISGYSNQGVNVDLPIATASTTRGGFGRWTISRFKANTISTCKVSWLHPNQATVVIEFEAFIGGWRIDDSRKNPLTGELQYAWIVNDTGAYLLNFVNNFYELKHPLHHGTG